MSGGVKQSTNDPPPIHTAAVVLQDWPLGRSCR